VLRELVGELVPPSWAKLVSVGEEASGVCTRLARACPQQQSKRTAARELLAPIYGWLTEGLDIADLQEPRALLDTLA
jgi:hypothetical protein